jgi:tRNA A37 N6-isopentenylltransferase MiaA
MRSLGYRHLAEHIQQGLDLDEAFRRTARDTRQLARKQRTWMRSLGWDRVAAGHVDAAFAAAERVFGTD